MPEYREFFTGEVLPTLVQTEVKRQTPKSDFLKQLEARQAIIAADEEQKRKKQNVEVLGAPLIVNPGVVPGHVQLPDNVAPLRWRR